MPLKLVPADRAKPMLEKLQFMTNAMIRRPQFFARDDAGVYYYVDQLAKAYGGEGYRVFSGKKGAMKPQVLTSVDQDTGGVVLSTASATLKVAAVSHRQARGSAESAAPPPLRASVPTSPGLRPYGPPVRSFV